jgi:Fe-S cluster biogenesis protein NfuA
MHCEIIIICHQQNEIEYSSSGDGWEHVVHVGITKDLANDISYFTSQKGSEAVAHVLALSFSYPQKATMEEFANGWRRKVVEAQQQQGGEGGGQMTMGDTPNNDNLGWGMVPSSSNADTTNLVGGKFAVDDDDDDYEEDDDDDDMDEDDLDDYLQMMAVSRAAVSSAPSAAATATVAPPLFVDNTGLTNIMSLKNRSEMPDVISPFETNNNNKNNATIARKQSSSPIIDDGEPLELGIENVDKVLDDVRPYLISDGGNVCVQNVDLETGNVYLLLEGACGSCASSTVTMKMGIERVLKEKFGDRLGEVIQVEPGGAGDEGAGGKPSELTIEAVQAEVNRMSAAITAMGGVVRVVSVDPIGVVEIEFRGPNRVKKGLELALLDVEFVKHVKFVS